jgi:1-phosphofructokinase
MIYTCTLNPSLDYFMNIEDEIKPFITNRSVSEYYSAGGKGVNVSIVLNNLRIPSKCVGFLGGFSYDFYIKNLENYEYLQPTFVNIKDNTRINLKIVGNNNEYDFNAKGPHIEESEMVSFQRRMDKVNSKDFFVLCGNVQPELCKMVKNGIKDFYDQGIRFILDTNIEIEKELLKYGPILIKPNKEELSSLVGRNLLTTEEIIAAAKDVVNLGAKNVIVSCGQRGSWLIDKEKVYHCNSIDGETKNVVGCGDAMIAGFLFNLQRGGTNVDAFKFANACSNATAFSQSFGTREEIFEILEKIKVEEIK